MSDFRICNGGYDGPEFGLPNECVHQVFERQASRVPHDIAVQFVSTAVSYAELNVRANQLSGQLRDAGVTPMEVVGVHLPRGVDMVVANLAVLKAGAAYVMLDPDYPEYWRRTAVEDTGTRVVVTDSATSAHVNWPGVHQLCVDTEADRIAEQPGWASSVWVDAAAPACVMFTSGTTGRAKGTVASHRALLASLLGQDFLEFSSERVWLQFSPVSWDIFMLELFGALLFGGRCILQPGQKPDPAAIAALVSAHGVDSLSFSSGLFAVMLDEYPEVFAAAYQVMFGGEEPSRSHVLAAHRRFPHLRLVNGYGAVETALVETYYVVGKDDFGRTRIPIGRPATNTRGYLLDERLKPVQTGCTGELYIASLGMAEGYAGQASLTSSRFVANPFGAAGERMYRTGDVVGRESDTTLALFGRTDQQVKVRGFRVELAEVEAALCGHPAVQRAVVLTRETRSGAHRIVAYVSRPVRDIAESELLDHVRTVLPEYSVPDAIVLIDALPLKPNGKVDRAALPVPEGTDAEGQEPRDERERVLCALFANVLNLQSVHVDDDFFQLGGDSLIAARLVNRIRSAFGTDVSQTALFEAPTVAELAHLLAGRRRNTRPALRRMREVKS